MPPYPDFGTFLTSLAAPPKRKVFISYHHRNDQAYYEMLSTTFAETYEIIYDNSIERIIESDNVEYVMQRIRDNFISGSSCTIVLCGSETPWRKYVDWEIKATLDKEHGLIGVNLPTNPITSNGTYIVPNRLNDNIQSGYAVWTNWSHILQNTAKLKDLIELAIKRPAALIKNNRPMMSRNETPPARR
jgi:hypothetical protein